MSKQETVVIVFIGLGSNLAAPDQQIGRARTAINNIKNVTELVCSSLYSSPPMGPKDQPDYVNAVSKIETGLPALELLRCMQTIENDQGRARSGQRWGARTLDLDLLLYGQQQIDIPDLVVPHPGIRDRNFVLYPLLEIAPELRIPGLGRLSDLIKACPLNGLKQIVKD